MYDYAGYVEHLRWLFEDWIEPYIVHPILQRMDEQTDLIVRAFGMKNFGQYYQQYYDKRTQIDNETRRLRRERLGKNYRLDSEDIEDSNPHEKGTVKNPYERATNVSFENLNRFFAQIQDVAQELYQEHLNDPSVKVQNDFEEMKSTFEKEGIQGYASKLAQQRHKKTSSDIDKYQEELIKSIEEAVPDVSDKPDENEFTYFGDKKISKVLTTEEFREQKNKTLLNHRDNMSEFVYETEDHFKDSMVKAYYEKFGFSSLEELKAYQEKIRKEDDQLRKVMFYEKLEEVNARRRKNNIPELKIEDIRVTESEFEKWKKDKGYSEYEI